jgi:hypothetical protein
MSSIRRYLKTWFWSRSSWAEPRHRHTAWKAMDRILSGASAAADDMLMKKQAGQGFWP